MLEGLGRTSEARMKTYAEEILTTANRAAGLTGQLLAFSRRQTAQPGSFDLRDLVSNLEQMLHRTIGEDVQLTVHNGTEPCPVRADRHQMEQVLINLVVNARDAMPLGGMLDVDCRAEGESVVLKVQDTGIGMDAATRARLFEPFFTSRERGKGTGLGLSMVYGVVSQAGGTIDVESEPGEGSTFCIRLPLVEPLAEEPRIASGAPHGTETVLVVEDEPRLRKLARHMLLRLGYQVLEAESGPRALRSVLDVPADPPPAGTNSAGA